MDSFIMILKTDTFSKNKIDKHLLLCLELGVIVFKSLHYFYFLKQRYSRARSVQESFLEETQPSK